MNGDTKGWGGIKADERGFPTGQVFFSRDADQEVTAARDAELAALETMIKPVIDAVAADQELSAVFNKFQSGLVYVSDSIDITDEVLKRVDKK